MRRIEWIQVVVLFSLLFAIGASAATAESGTRMLYLVRHGFYDYEDERDPYVGKALVPLGVAQSRLVAERLRSMPVQFDALYSSTMTRAHETALVIGEDFHYLKVEKFKQLAECTPATWREDIMAESDPAEIAACQEQIDAAFAKFFVPSEEGDRHDIVVCHGNVIRYLVTKVLGVDTLSWLVMSVGNCSLTVVRVNPDGTMKLLGVGDVGHLPRNLQTGLTTEDRPLVVPQD